MGGILSLFSGNSAAAARAAAETSKLGGGGGPPDREPLRMADLSSPGMRCNAASCIKIVGLIALVASAALFAFVTAYACGAFHWEAFIGSIGPSVIIPLSAALVILSAITLAGSYLRR